MLPVLKTEPVAGDFLKMKSEKCQDAYNNCKDCVFCLNIHQGIFLLNLIFSS